MFGSRKHTRWSKLTEVAGCKENMAGRLSVIVATLWFRSKIAYLEHPTPRLELGDDVPGTAAAKGAKYQHLNPDDIRMKRSLPIYGYLL